MSEQLVENSKELKAKVLNDYKYWRRRIFVASWIMYASYYLCRQNIAIAIPGIKQDLGFTDIQIGWITTGLFLAYMIGQVVNGLLGDKLGQRLFGTVGMALSALFNILFGLSYAFPIMLAIWVANGFVQSTGAPLRIKNLANWFIPTERGRMMGFLGTDYMVGNVISWILSGFLIAKFGWRFVFYVPGVIFLFSALFYYIRIRNQPEDVNLPSLEKYAKLIDPNTSQEVDLNVEEEKEEVDWNFIIKSSLGNYRVWIVGFAYFGVDLVRYGFMIWAPTYMFESGAGISEAAYKNAMIPLLGTLGIVGSGWLTDKIGGRRAPVISVMLLILAILAFFYKQIPQENTILIVVTLGLIGFFLYGPHLLMGATIAMDLGSRKASAAASGVIDGLGYAGASVAGIGTAYVKTNYGWDAAFALWISGAVVAAILMSTLWNFRTSEDQKYY